MLAEQVPAADGLWVQREKTGIAASVWVVGLAEQVPAADGLWVQREKTGIAASVWVVNNTGRYSSLEMFLIWM